ncbi:hypothetical protein MOQ_003284 [Trypanosoma cruzi marinkellei]|uniref:Uncharacterized protein n=1 Tax=Trypanosoma cruzi marinkellei TaxID=85056 RepID=K2ND76_TRYCR|nr:hypothetical protein MOQ_003284 [Trypanosoma cruzi marinkellei]
MVTEGEIEVQVLSIHYDVNVFRTYVKELISKTEPGVISPSSVCLLMTQPRLYRESQIGIFHEKEAKSNHFSQELTHFVDRTYMALETVLVLKVFEYREWQNLLNEMEAMSRYSGLKQKEKFTGNSGVNWSLLSGVEGGICSVPALFTIYIDSFGAYQASNGIRQLQTRSHVIAVLAQCSHIPMKVNILVRMSNADGKGSSEYISTEKIYLFYLVAYIVLFGILLFLILPCGSLSKKNSETTSLEHLNENRGGVGQTNSSTECGDSRRGNTNASEGGTTRPLREGQNEGRGLNLTSLENVWEITPEAENANLAALNLASRRRYSTACCDAFRNKIKNICSQYLLIFYPPLQWLVLTCLILRGGVCLLRLIQYRMLSESSVAKPNKSIDILSILLSVCTRTAVFVMQQLVCIGWGCAYERPPTIKIVTVSLVSITTFFAYVFQGTCDEESIPTTFTASDGHREYMSARCMKIQTVAIACEMLGWLINLFQLTTLMATIGRAAATGSKQGRLTTSESQTSLYLRYRGMCLPYALGIILPQILFVAFSNTLMRVEDYYVEVALHEFSQWYALALVLLFLRKEPLYI